jgi:hypothetical protein
MISFSKDAFRLSRQEILYMVIIGMLAVTMYFVYSIIEPLASLIEHNRILNVASVKQNDILLNLAVSIHDENLKRQGEHETLYGRQIQQLGEHDQITQKLMNSILLNTEILSKVNRTTADVNQTASEINRTTFQ